jgi:hypothetical protein
MSDCGQSADARSGSVASEGLQRLDADCVDDDQYDQGLAALAPVQRDSVLTTPVPLVRVVEAAAKRLRSFAPHSTVRVHTTGSSNSHQINIVSRSTRHPDATGGCGPVVSSSAQTVMTSSCSTVDMTSRTHPFLDIAGRLGITSQAGEDLCCRASRPAYLAACFLPSASTHVTLTFCIWLVPGMSVTWLQCIAAGYVTVCVIYIALLWRYGLATALLPAMRCTYISLLILGGVLLVCSALVMDQQPNWTSNVSNTAGRICVLTCWLFSAQAWAYSSPHNGITAYSFELGCMTAVVRHI